MTKIILASASISRIECLTNTGLKFDAENSEVFEYFSGRPNTPKELVTLLSRLKAENVAKKHDNGIIIGIDSVSFLDNEILEKPKDKAEAFKRIRLLSGKKFSHHSGIHMVDLETKKVLTSYIASIVKFRDIEDWEIEKVLNEDPDFTKFIYGFNARKGFGSTFIKEIDGNHSDVLFGISPAIIIEMLKEIGYFKKK